LLPIVLDPSKAAVGLAGKGPALAGRRDHLIEAGATPIEIDIDHPEGLTGLGVLYIAGADKTAAEALASRARALGIFVNVEDLPALFDFHVPATVRRGDFLLTASSAGQAPGLVRLVREWLETQFGPEWGGRVESIARKRANWRSRGLPPSEVSRKTRALADGWLA